MYSPRPNLAFLLLLNLFLALSPVHAAPLQRRQDPSGATTLMTQSTTDTPAGEMTQTCVITLTPVTDAHGNQEVQEVKTCTVTMNSVNNSGSSSSNNGTDSSSSSTDSSGSSSTDTSGSSSTDTSGSTTTDAGSGSGSASTTAAGVIANGVSTVAVSGTGTDSSAATSTDSSAASSTSDSSQASATSSSGGAAAVIAGSVSTIPISAVSTGAANAANAPPAATAAAENNAASASASAFTVPGQSIQVLPIGLGVFAGISVIALIVVGLVTYERTKYRKAFRARKLAESGAAMGYGGMAQR